MESLLLTGARRRWRGAFLLAAGLLTAALWIEPRALANAPRFPLNDHASASLDQALNLSLCRRAGVLSSIFGPARHLKLHPEDLSVPIRELVAAHAGSIGRYCASLTTPFTNNENTLMLMMSVAWVARPSWSADSINRALLWVRVLAVGLFGFACLEAGMSVALAFALVLGAMVVLGESNRYQYTVYPFMYVIPLAWAALCSLAAEHVGRASLVRLLLASVAAGVVAAFGANLRTSYWPLFFAGFLVTVAAITCMKKLSMPQVARFASVAIGGFAVGAWFFQVAVIRSTQRPAAGPSSNYVYHTIAHPLVLALAVPPNDLSRRESIRWEDANGPEIAERVIPGVAYLGPEYATALYRYYWTLWLKHPGDMARTYWLKLRSTGQGVILQASQLVPAWRPLRRLYLVWADRVNGFELLLAAMGCSVLAAGRFFTSRSPVALLVLFLGVTTVLLLTEAAIIYSTFFLAYHSFLMLMVLIAPAAALQAIADALWSLRRRRRRAPHEDGPSRLVGSNARTAI
jgi:hypothetical protein